jgi:hypothetical protein
VEHLADEFDLWGFVGVLLFELHHQAERSILKWRVSRSDYNGIPAWVLDSYSILLRFVR